MGHEAASDISIDLEGTPALVFCADGTVRLRCGIPREWEYFRALNVVMRAVDLRLTYDGDLDGDWQVARRSDRTRSAATLLSPHEDTILPAFDGGAFEHVQALVRRLPCDIEVAKVPHAQSTGADDHRPASQGSRQPPARGRGVCPSRRPGVSVAK
jgi:hypothetical protein